MEINMWEHMRMEMNQVVGITINPVIKKHGRTEIRTGNG